MLDNRLMEKKKRDGRFLNPQRKNFKNIIIVIQEYISHCMEC